MVMNRDEMRARVKAFAVRIIRVCGALPSNNVGWVLARQLVKAGTSIGANYCEALRSSSQSHFVSIMEIALREACETKYWLEVIADAAILPAERLHELDDECLQLVRILTTTVRTARRRLKDGQ
jgi:four helix bundle protein